MQVADTYGIVDILYPVHIGSWTYWTVDIIME